MGKNIFVKSFHFVLYLKIVKGYQLSILANSLGFSCGLVLVELALATLQPQVRGGLEEDSVPDVWEAGGGRHPCSGLGGACVCM